MSDKQREYLENELGEQKVKAAYMLVEMELAEPGYEGPRTQEELAEVIGVHYKTIWEWRKKDQNFIKYKNSIVSDFFSENRSIVYKQLMRLITASQPSVKAIDIFAKLEGLYDNKLTIKNEDSNTNGESNEDLAKSLEKYKAMKLNQEGK